MFFCLCSWPFWHTFVYISLCVYERSLVCIFVYMCVCKACCAGLCLRTPLWVEHVSERRIFLKHAPSYPKCVFFAIQSVGFYQMPRASISTATFSSSRQALLYLAYHRDNRSCILRGEGGGGGTGGEEEGGGKRKRKGVRQGVCVSEQKRIARTTMKEIRSHRAIRGMCNASFEKTER